MRTIILALCLLASPAVAQQMQNPNPATNQKLIEALQKQRARAAKAAEQQKKADEETAKAKKED